MGSSLGYDSNHDRDIGYPLHLRRLTEWRRAVVSAGRTLSWWAMARALLSGTVPRAIWRQRIRVCGKCPVYRPETRTCGGSEPRMGCGCYVPFKALAAEPYPGGCWVRSIGVANEGWPAWRKTAISNPQAPDPALEKLRLLKCLQVGLDPTTSFEELASIRMGGDPILTSEEIESMIGPDWKSWAVE
jgi:hypothetical protein